MFKTHIYKSEVFKGCCCYMVSSFLPKRKKKCYKCSQFNVNIVYN